MRRFVTADQPAGPSAAECGPPSTGLDPSLDVERIATVARALGEPVRVQILDVLRRHGQPLCQCELLPLFDGMTQPLFSHHVSKLVAARLVDVERRHRWAYYSAAEDALEEVATWMAT
jgi:ArsR family transcriptional regulator, arsenate/arsenite/antimonite-responsive transcriptional repressor